MEDTIDQVIQDSEEDYLNSTYWLIAPLFRLIARGDTDQLAVLLDLKIERYDFHQRVSRDERKQLEYMAVSLINTFMIAAMQGGLYPARANWIADHALRRLLKCRAVADISPILNETAMEMCREVRKSQSSDTGNPHVEKAKAFIHTHLTQEISNEEIAEAVQISLFHLSRIFKECTGKTLHDYLMSARIEAAKEYLISSDQTIPQIAFLFRFCDQSHFTRVFRKFTGLTPNQYRRENHQQRSPVYQNKKRRM